MSNGFDSTRSDARKIIARSRPIVAMLALAPVLTIGSAPSSYDGESCSDHGYAYAAYAVDSLVWMIPLLFAD
jgi:hypothetical protein